VAAGAFVGGRLTPVVCDLVVAVVSRPVVTGGTVSDLVVIDLVVNPFVVATPVMTDLDLVVTEFVVAAFVVTEPEDPQLG